MTKSIEIQGGSDSEENEDRKKKNEIAINYGKASIIAHGSQALALIALFGILGSIFYMGYRIEQTLNLIQAGISVTMTQLDKSMLFENDLRAKEHRALQNNLDKTSCILSMTQDERSRFRNNYQPGMWNRWCPWIEEK